MLDIQNLSKNYESVEALKKVSFSYNNSGVYGLVGPNASGKTTLIKIVLGLVHQSSGKVLFNGFDIQTQPTYKRNIGYMAQIADYPPNLTVKELFDLIRKLRHDFVDSDLDHELVELFGIPEMNSKKLGTLSGGTTQKVSAALAFLYRPQLLILDEPTAGLDPIASEIIKSKIVKTASEGRTVIITTHNLAELNDVIDGITFLEDGELRLHQSTTELLQSTRQSTVSDAILYILRKDL